MKKLFLLIIVLAAHPSLISAQSIDESVFRDQFAYASFFAGNFSLLLSIVIGIIAAFLVFRAAKRLGGGLFGIVLNFIATGMLLIVIGTVSTFSNPWFGGFWSNVISTASFAAGYILTVIGANKLFKGIMSA